MRVPERQRPADVGPGLPDPVRDVHRGQQDRALGAVAVDERFRALGVERVAVDQVGRVDVMDDRLVGRGDRPVAVRQGGAELLVPLGAEPGLLEQELCSRPLRGGRLGGVGHAVDVGEDSGRGAAGRAAPSHQLVLGRDLRGGLLPDLGAGCPGDYARRAEGHRDDQPHRGEADDPGDRQQEQGQRDRGDRGPGPDDQQQVAGVGEREQSFAVDEGGIARVEERVQGKPGHGQDGAQARQAEGGGQPLHLGASLATGGPPESD